jgi:hypothetical protein
MTTEFCQVRSPWRYEPPVNTTGREKYQGGGTVESEILHPIMGLCILIGGCGMRGRTLKPRNPVLVNS